MVRFGGHRDEKKSADRQQTGIRRPGWPKDSNPEIGSPGLGTVPRERTHQVESSILEFIDIEKKRGTMEQSSSDSRTEQKLQKNSLKSKIYVDQNGKIKLNLTGLF